MNQAPDKFAQMQAADRKAERRILWGEICVLALLALVAGLYGYAFG